MNVSIVSIEILKLYMESMGEDKELSVWKIMEWIRQFYIGEEMTEFEEGLKRRVEFLITAVDATDAPAFCTKIIAEKYKKDFWDLWETVKDVVSRKLENEYYLVPYQTEDFLNISKDDNYYQIYTFNNFWEETSKRRLKCTWDIMPHNEKNNMARVKLRRYMALLGNTQLRKRVFGF